MDGKKKLNAVGFVYQISTFSRDLFQSPSHKCPSVGPSIGCSVRPSVRPLAEGASKDRGG